MFERGIAVIGLGYIGLPTSAAIAMQGVTVKGVDVNQATVAAINCGEVSDCRTGSGRSCRRRACQGPAHGQRRDARGGCLSHRRSDTLHRGQDPDLSYVQAAAEAIAPRLSRR